MNKVFAAILVFLNAHIIFAQSPYKEYSSIDNVILGGSALLGATTLYLEHRMAPLTPEQAGLLDGNSINRFDRRATLNLSERSAILSDYGMLAALVAPLGLLADSKIRDEPEKLGYLYLETMAITGVLTELTKVTVQRVRPWAYNKNVPLEHKNGTEAKKAFFSGHTSATFAGAVLCAKVYSDYNPDSKLKPYVWAGSMALSSAVAYWRVRAGRHFPTDVLVGALVGGGVAYLIPEIHKTDKAGPGPGSVSQPMMIHLNFAF